MSVNHILVANRLLRVGLDDYDTAIKTAKRGAAETTLDNVSIGDDVLENVLNFEYLGSRLQCDGDDQVDVRHRMDIAQAAFGSLSHLCADHRLSRETKLRLYKLSVCSSLAHSLGPHQNGNSDDQRLE